jgi:predicted DNA-binding transcriptional regulator YafY
MIRTNRLFQLMQCLRSGAPPHTAGVLAHELGVSARTVHRDIDTLRGLGAVIDGAAGLGITLIEDAALPPMGFDNDELEALVLGLREVEQIGDPDLAQAAGRALRKLQGRLPPSQSQRLKHAVLSAKQFRQPAPPSIAFAALRQATRDELAVEFGYEDAKGMASQRQVNPLAIVYMDQSTVLLAWYHLRVDFRVFRLDRMQDFYVTDQSFRSSRVPMLRDALTRIQEDTEQMAKARDPDD